MNDSKTKILNSAAATDPEVNDAIREFVLADERVLSAVVVNSDLKQHNPYLRIKTPHGVAFLPMFVIATYAGPDQFDPEVGRVLVDEAMVVAHQTMVTGLFEKLKAETIVESGDDGEIIIPGRRGEA